MHRLLYDLVYRVGAPWDGPPRSELVELVESGVLAPDKLAPAPRARARAIDLGCGGGANTIFLAQHGYEVTGVDFSAVALLLACDRARSASVGDRVRFVEADLTAAALPRVSGPFDLLVDYGTLDDLGPAGRSAMARLIVRLARPGARFLMWCFHGRRADLPVISFRGPSRLTPVIEPGEVERLFGHSFDIARLPAAARGTGVACFLMTRRSDA